MFSQRFRRSAVLTAAGVLFAGPSMARAQLMPEPAIELLAKRRVFVPIGPGLRVIRSDHAGHYYILIAPGEAVLVLDAQGQRLRQVPPAPTPSGPAAEGVIFSTRAANRRFNSSVSPGTATKVPDDCSPARLAAACSTGNGVSKR